jgi:hemolysin III
MRQAIERLGAGLPGETAAGIVSIIGGGLALIGLPFLLTDAVRQARPAVLAGFCVYALAILAWFSLGSLSHLLPRPRARLVFGALDTGATYFLVASSWLPFCIAHGGAVGWVLFGLLWGLSGLGILAYLFGGRRLNEFWYIVFFLGFTIASPLLAPVHAMVGETAFPWLVLEGLLWAIGLLFRSRTSMPYNHGIWHAFGLSASICHFFALFALI